MAKALGDSLPTSVSLAVAACYLEPDNMPSIVLWHVCLWAASASISLLMTEPVEDEDQVKQQSRTRSRSRSKGRSNPASQREQVTISSVDTLLSVAQLALIACYCVVSVWLPLWAMETPVCKCMCVSSCCRN